MENRTLLNVKKYKSTDKRIYQASLKLRDALLRQPIGKSIYEEDLTIEQGNDFYGVFQGEDLIGTLSFFEKQPHVAQLTAFAVKREFQRCGLGKKLVAFLIADLQKRGYQKVIVDARAEARFFYQKCGFTIEKGPVINQKLGVKDYQMKYVIEKNL